MTKASKVFCSVEGDIEFSFDYSRLPSGMIRSWSPAGQLIEMPRVHKKWGIQNGGNWEKADVGLIKAKIDEKIDRRITLTGVNVPGPIVMLDAEWSKAETIVGLTKLAQIVDHIKQKRPTARVFMYNFAQGADVTDGVAASMYVGKPTMMIGSHQFYWPPSYFRAKIKEACDLWRGDKDKVLVIHRKYDQDGPNLGRPISDYELGILLETAVSEGADILTWDHARKADKPLVDPTTGQTMIDSSTNRPITLEKSTQYLFDVASQYIVQFHQAIADLLWGAYER